MYLQQRNEEQQRAQEAYDSYVREQKEQGAMKQLSDEERQSILEVRKHDQTQWQLPVKWEKKYLVKHRINLTISSSEYLTLNPENLQC